MMNCLNGAPALEEHELRDVSTRAKLTAMGGVLVVLVVGCTSLPGSVGLSGDGDATYKVENRPGGFLISSTSSRNQFAAERDAKAACKKSLVATAHDYADSFGRKIEPVAEERIRITVARNASTGLTNCEASVPVVWAR